jgi:multicomponent Na+:H+ antiporter subunit A
VSSFLLIGHHYRTESSQYAARKSMLVTVAGGLFMLAGFLVLHVVAGDVAGVESTYRLAGEGSLLANADAVRAALETRGLLVPVLLLVGVGAAAKSAQVPLHLWLPNAMEAPTPVSAFLHSATMVKAGVYLVGRFRPLLFTPEWLLVFATLGLLTMTVTAILAVAASDIKELLAYSTASHLGLIVAGFGLSEALGAEVGSFHILNHALFKAALFLVAGIVAHEAGTRAIDELGGLRHELPVTAAVTAVAALGMAGLPPFNGLYSKELLFEAAYHAFEVEGGLWWILPAVAVFGSVFTFLYSIRFLMLFFGERRAAVSEVERPPLSMLAPAVLLVTLAGIVGIGGILSTFGVHIGVEGFVERVVESTVLAETEPHFAYYLPTSASPAALMSALTIVAGVVLYPSYDRIRDGVRWLTSISATSPNYYYDGITRSLDRSSAIDLLHTGHLRTYAIWLFAATSALTLGGFVAARATLPAFSGIVVTIPIVIVLLVAVVGAVAITDAPSHIAGVLFLSIVGFMIAIFYILGDAPDLALTQLVVETLLLVLFLLILDRLPAFYGSPDRARIVADGVVSLLVGATVAATVLLTTADSPGVPEYLDASLPAFFVERGGVPAEHGSLIVDYGGGHNIVNVILVDFRALDTLGEISVVGLAALSVVTIFAMRDGGEVE